MTQHAGPAGNTITVTVNGTPRGLEPDLPVEGLVALLTGTPAGIAVAVNGTVVPRSRWAQDRLHDGDAVEVVTAVQGG